MRYAIRPPDRKAEIERKALEVQPVTRRDIAWLVITIALVVLLLTVATVWALH